MPAKKKKRKVTYENSPLLRRFSFQQKQADARTSEQIEEESSRKLRLQMSGIFGPAMKDIRTILEELKLGKMHGTKGRPRTLRNDAFILGGTMYAEVGAAVFNEVITETKSDGTLKRTGRSLLLDSIWDLANEYAAQKAKQNVQIQKEQIRNNEFRGRKSRGNYKEWSSLEKKIAVSKLFQMVEVESRKDEYAWRTKVSDVVGQLKLESDVFKSLQRQHLFSWYNKFFVNGKQNGWEFNYGCLDDSRNVANENAKLVPTVVKESVEGFISELVAQKIEVNITILRPFIIRFIREEIEDGQYACILDGNDGKRAFRVSRGWIRLLLKASKYSYRAITNDAGKLPENWEEEKQVFLTRIAYMIAKFKVPKCLLINMDETPLMWLSTSGKTWAPTNASNVMIQGSKDKRQATGTPWITAEGVIPFFHVTIKGTTDRCLPRQTFRSDPKFNGETKLMFGYSQNHWVSKDTMRDQVNECESYRRRIVREQNLAEDQRMIVLWDVYVRHRDPELLEWMKNTYPYIVLIFIPANLTELCQPLDIYFNARFKTLLTRLKNEYVTSEFWDHRKRENERKAACDASGEQYTPHSYKMKTKISETKELFYNSIIEAISEMQTEQEKRKLSEHAFADIMKCFDNAYQVEALLKVNDDATGRYFRRIQGEDDEIQDVTIQRFERSVVYEAAMIHNNLPTREDDISQIDYSKFVGRLVSALDGRYPGMVKETRNLRARDIPAQRRRIFIVKYYRESIDEGKAKAVLQYTREELLPLLVVADERGDLDDLEEDGGNDGISDNDDSIGTDNNDDENADESNEVDNEQEH